MLSRNGICYDLKMSHYRHERNGLIFVFSSQLHLDKFIERLEENRKAINISLSKRFNLSVDVSSLADVVLYKKIETRGFLIETKEGAIECLRNLKCAGGKVTPQSCKE